MALGGTEAGREMAAGEGDDWLPSSSFGLSNREISTVLSSEGGWGESVTTGGCGQHSINVTVLDGVDGPGELG